MYVLCDLNCFILHATEETLFIVRRNLFHLNIWLRSRLRVWPREAKMKLSTHLPNLSPSFIASKSTYQEVAVNKKVDAERRVRFTWVAVVPDKDLHLLPF